LPTIRAEIELNKGNAARAIELLKEAEPYEMGVQLDPTYVRGLAYLSNHQGTEATNEFQKILDHRGLIGNSDLVPLSRLGLARAYTLQGDETKARTAYQDFFSLWKDADPDIPILKHAKAEYAKLK
jgi:predicted Zn-dependent protease